MKRHTWGQDDRRECSFSQGLDRYTPAVFVLWNKTEIPSTDRKKTYLVVSSPFQEVVAVKGGTF